MTSPWACSGLWASRGTEEFRLCKAGEPCILQVGGTRIGVSRTVAPGSSSFRTAVRLTT